MIRDRWWKGRATAGFTLQWHVTNACGANCAHCYDRSARGETSLSDAKKIIRQLLDFCRRRRVRPHVCLSGGDPFLHSSIWEILQAIAEANIPLSILGNPIGAETLGRLLAVRRPVYYQVSLEGLPEHNDAVRGAGHFERVMEFLKIARPSNLETHVMLTLTRDNMNQVIPLGGILRGYTALFTFNRLAQVGGGSNLAQPSREEYARFLERYSEAARNNPVFGFKDNLFNIIRQRHRRPLTPGCTGTGCGAAFNFLALLPDGEAHACRKFPSPVGNIATNTLEEIYDSETAKTYRAGCAACRKCPLRRRCGGCMAVTFGAGLDPLRDRDPLCFVE